MKIQPYLIGFYSRFFNVKCTGEDNHERPLSGRVQRMILAMNERREEPEQSKGLNTTASRIIRRILSNSDRENKAGMPELGPCARTSEPTESGR